jgi:hypothetical protein
MQHLSPTKTALAVRTFLGGWHLVWSLSARTNDTGFAKDELRLIQRPQSHRARTSTLLIGSLTPLWSDG